MFAKIIGEIIGEVILQPILEIAVCGIGYGVGFIVLKIGSLGKNNTIINIGTKKEKEKKWYQIDISIWENKSKNNKIVSAEITLILGLVSIVIFGVILYFLFRK